MVFLRPIIYHFLLFCIVSTTFFGSFAFAGQVTKSLSLDEYLKISQASDPNYLGAKTQASGSENAAEAADMATDTRVFADVYSSDDRRPTQNPNFQGSQTEAKGWDIGIKKQTGFGPSFTVSQNFSHVIITNAAATAVPDADYIDAFPKIEISIPLWQNFWGAHTRAEVEASKAEMRRQKILTDIQFVKAQADLEMAFHRLSAEQEIWESQTDILKRAKDILDWIKKQRQKGLVDITDVHQANAAVTLRQLELTDTETNLKEASRRFNAYRNIDSSVVSENLTPVKIQLSELKLNKTEKRVRLDVLTNQLAGISTEKGFIVQRELAKPQLDLQMKAQWVGRDDSSSSALQEVSEKDQPYYYLGLNFSVPLNIPKYIRVRSGLRSLEEGQTQLVQALDRENKLSWESFVDLGQQLSEQILLLRQLEEIQKNKSQAERLRFQRGRSVTFQVLSFEQDYISTRSRRIRTELQAFDYLTQTKLFQ